MGAVLHIPLIEDLTTGPIPAGSNIIVEFDPTSQWYNAAHTIAAGWLMTGGSVLYILHAQPPDSARTQLRRLGLNTEDLEANAKLVIQDGYTITLDQKSKEKYAYDSMKVADLSIQFLKQVMKAEPQTDLLRMVDNLSILARYNDEKAFVKFMEARAIPSASLMKSTTIVGFIRGLHSDWLYKNLEAAVDGVIDFKLEESGEETRNLIRIRSMRNVGFDSRWYPLKIGENFAITLDKSRIMR